MNLFEVQARSDRSEVYPQRKWLIVADSLYEAVWLVPQEWTVGAVEVTRAAARGPSRVIGWMTGSMMSGMPGGPEPAAMKGREKREVNRPIFAVLIDINATTAAKL